MAYTYEQLKQMGATPGPAQTPAVPTSNVTSSVQSTTPKKKYTYQELVAKGATPVTPSPQPAREEKGEGFLKSIVKAPLTIAARPIQLAAEAIMPGDNTEAIDKFSREKLGGFVAPLPQNLGDVKKDIGRGAQTVAFGMPGLASAGAVFGAGSSLEKGNELFSKETALETGLGAAGSKIAGTVAKPLLKAAGSVVSKIAPEAVETVSKKAGSIFPSVSKPVEESIITKAAQKAENIANVPFQAGKKILPKAENLVAKTTKIENTAAAKKFKQMHGETMDEYLVNTGNINKPEKAMQVEYQKALTSQKLGEQQMKNVPGVYKNDYVKTALDDLIAKEQKIGIPGKESKEIVRLANKYQKEGLTFDESNRVKQLYEKNVKLDFLKENAADNIKRATRIDDGIRDWQRKTAEKGGYTNLAEMMKQTQKARAVADALYRSSLKGDLSKGGIGLFDAVLVSGIGPEGLALAAGRRLLSSDTARVGLANLLANKPTKGLITPKQGPIKDFFLPEPKAGTPKTTQKPFTTKIKGSDKPLFASPKGSISPVKQSATDIASVDLGKAKQPKSGKGAARQAKTIQEMAENVPFVNPKTLPKIEIGSKPKIKDAYADLPVIEFGKGKTKINKQKGSALTNLVAGTGAISALGAGGAKLADLYKQSKEYNNKVYKPSQKEEPKSKVDLRKGFVHSENRGAKEKGEDLYKVKGVTGDLGKYQVKPETLKDWSKPWLGKTYSPQEFLNDPNAQEEFMNQFIAIVDSYDLSPEDAAVLWHKGWGVLGDSRPREEKKKALRKYIDSKKGEASAYVNTFKEGLTK